MLKNYMKRDKFFWVNPTLFNDREWPYESRYAIGVRLADFTARNEPVFRFEVNGTMYTIDRTRAFKLGLKYMIPQGTLPNLIPLNEFKVKPLKKEEPIKPLTLFSLFFLLSFSLFSL